MPRWLERLIWLLGAAGLLAMGWGLGVLTAWLGQRYFP